MSSFIESLKAGPVPGNLNRVFGSAKLIDFQLDSSLRICHCFALYSDRTWGLVFCQYTKCLAQENIFSNLQRNFS